MQKVTEHDHVTVIYEGLLNNGEVFESSEETGPLSFQMGTDSVLPAFEKALLGMTANETKTIKISPEEGYGAKQQELIHTLPKTSFGDREIKPGMVLGLTVEKDGQKHKVPALVTEISGEVVTVDFNHPLAGQELSYQITLKSINQIPQPASQAGCNCQSSCGTGTVS